MFEYLLQSAENQANWEEMKPLTQKGSVVWNE